MRFFAHRRQILLCLMSLTLVATSCGQKKSSEELVDHPQLTPNVISRDVAFYSRALDRQMVYRAILPTNIRMGQKLPVIYLLHGGGGNHRDWSNYSDVARYAESGLILVMPEGNSSYYTNSATNAKDRYEDYIVKDLIAEVESKFPAMAGRENRAIVGVSMGGYGAIKIALRFPELFVFAAGISPALDVPSRPFSIKRVSQWRFHSSIFGAWGSQTRHDNDPFTIARSADPNKATYLYLTGGEQEGLLPSIRRFADLLAQRHFQCEFRTGPGDHNWAQWDQQIPRMFQILLEHINPQS